MTLALEIGGIRDPQVQRALQVIAQQFPVAATGGGGGGAPSGPAGGDLAGTYPNPGIAPLVIVDGDISATAAIAESKLALATDAAAGTGSRRTLGTGALQAAAGNDSRFPAGADIVDADVSATAAIAESKLNLATDAAAGTGSRRTLGTTATSAAAGNRGMPAAGTTGQALVKNTATDYDASWTTIGTGGAPSGPAGGDLTGSYPNPTLAVRDYWLLRLAANSASVAAAGGTLAVPWTTEDADPAGLHAASASTVVIAKPGLYMVGFALKIGAGGQTAVIQKNAVNQPQGFGDGTSTTTGWLQTVGLMVLAAADTLRVLVTNTAGAAQVITGNTTDYQAAKFFGYHIGPS